MIRKIQIVFALSMGVLAGMMLAQTDADFQGWMKGAVAANGKLKGAIAAKDAATVTASAKTLEENFKQIEMFFGKRNAADAVAIAKGNHENAAKMGKAAAAGDFDTVAASAAAIGGSCQGCHSVHREGAKGGPYSIK